MHARTASVIHAQVLGAPSTPNAVEQNTSRDCQGVAWYSIGTQEAAEENP